MAKDTGPKWPRRWKRQDELTPPEHAELMSARNAGETPPKFETEAYRTFRDGLGEHAGTTFKEPDEQSESEARAEKPLEDWTVEDHVEHMQEQR